MIGIGLGLGKGIGIVRGVGRGGSTSQFGLSQLFSAGEAGVIFDPSVSGTLYTTTAMTIPALPGDPVGMMLDQSGNGHHAQQATAAKRPTYGIEPVGGRRNLLTYTEDFGNSVWSKQPAGTGTIPVVSSNAGVSPDGSITADRIQFNQGTGVSSGDLSLITRSLTAPTDFYALSLWLKSNTGLDQNILFYNGANKVGAEFVVTGEWQRFTLADSNYSNSNYTAAAGPNIIFGLRGGAGSQFFNGTNTPLTADILVWGAQLEAGATATDYQKVTSQYDVTEADVSSVHYIAFDGVDDALPAAITDLGTNATVAFATDAGTTILTGQTIPAGAFESLRGVKTYAVLAVDRPLTTAETAEVAKLLDAKRGAA